MSSRDTKVKRTLLESGLGLLAKEYGKNPSYGHTGMQGMVPWALRALSNSNWTEWSTIQRVIERVISKSDQRSKMAFESRGQNVT